MLYRPSALADRIAPPAASLTELLQRETQRRCRVEVQLLMARRSWRVAGILLIAIAGVLASLLISTAFRVRDSALGTRRAELRAIVLRDSARALRRELGAVEQREHAWRDSVAVLAPKVAAVSAARAGLRRRIELAAGDSPLGTRDSALGTPQSTIRIDGGVLEAPLPLVAIVATDDTLLALAAAKDTAQQQLIFTLTGKSETWQQIAGVEERRGDALELALQAERKRPSYWRGVKHGAVAGALAVVAGLVILR